MTGPHLKLLNSHDRYKAGLTYIWHVPKSPRMLRPGTDTALAARQARKTRMVPGTNQEGARKKRGSNYNLTMQPREELKARLANGDNSFETK